ncbi:MAG: TldD/PmbA family protein [candidate division WS1 bacterium]|nr:TldD/PmbA family protein [candidate division WS1 bacterium]
MEDLTAHAVEAALKAGASYADARYVSQKREETRVKNGAAEGLHAGSSTGIGIRVLAEGAWGFAATATLTLEALGAAAQQAVRIARASAATRSEPVQLSPVEPAEGRFPATARQNPFDVPMDKRVQLLLDCDHLMAEAAEVQLRGGHVEILHEEKYFESSEGARIYQERIETGAGIECTAVAPDGSEMQRRSYPGSHSGQTAQRGWELVEELDLPGHAEEIARGAEALLSAPHCPATVTDVILEGSQLALQLHESCGHPIELDRVLGMEASYAGTSFLTPEKLDTFRYGSEHVNINADATLPEALGSFAYDDEGVPAQRTPIVEQGLFCGYLSSRETAPTIGRTSSGAMRADGWNRQPIIRMTNINLEPGDWTLEELISETKRGLYLATNTSWSIDDKRLNFQFAVEAAYRIEDGVLGELLRNATYTGITPEFWSSCDAVCDRDHWYLWGVPNCGKGEPGQIARVGHGVAPSRFRDVRVGVMQEDK